MWFFDVSALGLFHGFHVAVAETVWASTARQTRRPIPAIPKRIWILLLMAFLFIDAASGPVESEANELLSSMKCKLPRSAVVAGLLVTMTGIFFRTASGYSSIFHRIPRTKRSSFLRLKERQGESFDEKSMVRSLLSAASKRARSTLSDTTTAAGDEPAAGPDQRPPSIVDDASPIQQNESWLENLVDSTVERAESVLSQRYEGQSSFVNASQPLTEFAQVSLATEDSQKPNNRTDNGATSSTENPNRNSESMPTMTYRGNPAITTIALAHSLWSTILRPHVDTAIDATCGNGHDSLVLARLLFPPENKRSTSGSLSRLICIDVQERACEKTERSLVDEFGNDDMLQSGQIQVLQTSHAPLPMNWARQTSNSMELDENLPIALVVYNLGWLPSNVDGGKEDCITQMDTTLESMVDAMLLLRVGGMLSVTTYPKTNAAEDVAVRTFLECAALLSSNVETWQSFLGKQDTSISLVEDGERIVDLVRMSIQRLVDQGEARQTWRVSEHKKLGMDRAPILLTATRIK